MRSSIHFDEIERGICLIFISILNKSWIYKSSNSKENEILTLFDVFFLIATAVEDDDDDDDDDEDDSDAFSDNENSEEMIDEENKDFGLKSLLEEDENKQSQVKLDVTHSYRLIRFVRG